MDTFTTRPNSWYVFLIVATDRLAFYVNLYVNGDRTKQYPKNSLGRQRVMESRIVSRVVLDGNLNAKTLLLV